MPAFHHWHLEEIRRFKEDSDKLLDLLCENFGLPSVRKGPKDEESAWTMFETETDVFIEAHVPESIVHSIDIIISHGYLFMTFNPRFPHQDQRPQQRYQVRLTLPCRIQTETAEALFSNDLLRIRMPKNCSPLVRRIPITLKK